MGFKEEVLELGPAEEAGGRLEEEDVGVRWVESDGLEEGEETGVLSTDGLEEEGLEVRLLEEFDG